MDINGFNFFTGEYTRKPGEARSLSNTQDPGQWEEFWRDALGEEPPGPLPKGAWAIMLAQNTPPDHVKIEPESLVMDDDGLKVVWKRIHLAGQPGGPKTSRYAVLVLPAMGQQTTRETTWEEEAVRAAEDKKRQDAALDTLREAFIEGSAERVTILPPLRFKPKLDFLKL